MCHLDAAACEEVRQIRLDAALDVFGDLGLLQVQPECHVLLVERLPPFREFEEALGDQSDGNGKGRQRKEHENQNEDALGQVHWRHFCWHSSHDTKCPVKAENICL